MARDLTATIQDLLKDGFTQSTASSSSFEGLNDNFVKERALRASIRVFVG